MNKNRNKLDLLIQLVRTSFKLRYNNSVLGFIWVLLKPFLTFIILYLVWSRVIGQTAENYRVNLLLGIIVYTFFSEGITLGMNSLLDKAHIILKVNFPRQIAVLSGTIMALINLCINILIFIVIGMFDHASYTVGTLLYTLFVLVMMYIFILAASLFTSIFLVYLRDLRNITEIGFQLLFWATPIVYSVGSGVIKDGGLDGFLKAAIRGNPLGIVIDTVRSAMILSRIDNVGLMVIYFIVSCILCVIGWIYFNKQVKTVAEAF